MSTRRTFLRTLLAAPAVAPPLIREAMRIKVWSPSLWKGQPPAFVFPPPLFDDAVVKEWARRLQSEAMRQSFFWYLGSGITPMPARPGTMRIRAGHRPMTVR